jgi:hypothetical protein
MRVRLEEVLVVVNREMMGIRSHGSESQPIHCESYGFFHSHNGILVYCEHTGHCYQMNGKFELEEVRGMKYTLQSITVYRDY